MNEPGTFLKILNIAAWVLGPPAIAVAFAFIQLGIYKLLRRAGVVAEDGIPIFPVLMLRGFMVLIAFIAVMTFYTRFGLGEPGFRPPAP